ncbi:MAG TPA: universal stress protein [Candidatus Dormibacteraeota bacterium]|nr:universal stress protein [Candidatus Dormibacteraeota bacterium]
MSEQAVRGRTVVVGVDGSPAAQAALHWAIEYARAVGAEVVAVHAYEGVVTFSDPYGAAMPTMLDPELCRSGVRQSFEEDWCGQLASAGVPSRKVLADGPAAGVVLDVAEREAADLVVTGRRGLNVLGELVLGSVSRDLVHHSKRPVVLVPGGHQVAA